MDILSVSSGGTKRATQKVFQPLQLIQVVATITGDFSGAADRIAAFHAKLATAILTITKRNADGSVSDLLSQRPLDEVLNIDAIATARYIHLKSNGTASLTISGSYDLGNAGSLFNNNTQYLEVTLDLGGTTATDIVLTGFSNDFANTSYKKLDVISCLPSQPVEFAVEPGHARIALPATTTRFLLKSSQQVDQDLTLDDLKFFLRDTMGLCFVDNGTIAESRNWFVFPYSAYSQKASVTTSAAAVVYIVKIKA